MPTDQSDNEAVQTPAQDEKEAGTAKYTDRQKKDNDPYRGHGGDFVINEEGNRVPVPVETKDETETAESDDEVDADETEK